MKFIERIEQILNEGKGLILSSSFKEDFPVYYGELMVHFDKAGFKDGDEYSTENGLLEITPKALDKHVKKIIKLAYPKIKI